MRLGRQQSSTSSAQREKQAVRLPPHATSQGRGGQENC